MYGRVFGVFQRTDISLASETHTLTYQINSLYVRCRHVLSRRVQGQRMRPQASSLRYQVGVLRHKAAQRLGEAGAACLATLKLGTLRHRAVIERCWCWWQFRKSATSSEAAQTSVSTFWGTSRQKHRGMICVRRVRLWKTEQLEIVSFLAPSLVNDAAGGTARTVNKSPLH